MYTVIFSLLLNTGLGAVMGLKAKLPATSSVVLQITASPRTVTDAQGNIKLLSGSKDTMSCPFFSLSVSQCQFYLLRQDGFSLTNTYNPMLHTCQNPKLNVTFFHILICCCCYCSFAIYFYKQKKSINLLT